MDEIAKADRLIADGNAAKEWLEQHRTEVETLKLDIDRNKAKLNDASEKYQKRQEELDALTQLVADKHAELTKTAEKKATLDVNLSEIKEKISVLTASLEQKQKKEQELIAGINALRYEQNELDAKVKDLVVKEAYLNQPYYPKEYLKQHHQKKVQIAFRLLLAYKINFRHANLFASLQRE